MKTIVTGEEMKLLDDNTSKVYGVPSVILMEQAAMGVVRELVASFSKETKFLVVCGKGNNAGDGIAIARLLNQNGMQASVFFCSDKDEGSSELFLLQKNIYKNYAYPVENEIKKGYDVIIDAVFGTGLSRGISGRYLKVIEDINRHDALKAAIDIASGIHAASGGIMNAAVKADITYTFSYEKTGQILWPGNEYTGKLVTIPIGITDDSFVQTKPHMFSIEEKDLKNLPKRPDHSNKGTYGRLLVIAGSYNMAGAAVLSAKAAYRCGCGLVKVLTPQENRIIIQDQVPEALIGTYDDIEGSLEWADAVVLGPGIGKQPQAVDIVHKVLEKCDVPLLIDADGLNIISDDISLLNKHKNDIVITPHPGEMSRLTGKEVRDIQRNLIDTACLFAKQYDLVCVLKDFRTITADKGKTVFINRSGNSGMATAGSGDVLSGVIGAFLAGGMETAMAASYGAFVHGLAGDKVFIKTGSCGMMASDIIKGLKEIWNKVD